MGSTPTLSIVLLILNTISTPLDYSAIAEKSAEIEAISLTGQTTKNTANYKTHKKSSDNGMLNHLKKELQHQVNLMPHP